MLTAKYECRNADRQGGSVWVDQWKYDVMRRGIMKALTAVPSLSFKELVHAVKGDLPIEVKSNIGSIGWYTKTVTAELVRRSEIQTMRHQSTDYFYSLSSYKEMPAEALQLKSLAR